MATQQLSLLERRLVAWGALVAACGSRGPAGIVVLRFCG